MSGALQNIQSLNTFLAERKPLIKRERNRRGEGRTKVRCLLGSHNWLAAEVEITSLDFSSLDSLSRALLLPSCKFVASPDCLVRNYPRSVLCIFQKNYPLHIPQKLGLVCKAEAQREVFFPPIWFLMLLANAWGQNSNNNNGHDVLAHKHLAPHSVRCLVSHRG